MKIFITGGSGFIGHHVVEQLTQQGHELRCLVRKTSNTGRLAKQGVTLIIGDGSKATRELGIAYTPIRTAIEEEIATMH